MTATSLRPSLTAIPPDLLSPTVIAAKLSVAKTALYGWLARGLIAYTRVGRLIRVRESDVAAYLERNWVERDPHSQYGHHPKT